ncbi:MAG: hypothetical protein VX668_01460 [Planctomycetota bacterium]|nr:hypothetical protein [Planctomycetota bacterium]
MRSTCNAKATDQESIRRDLAVGNYETGNYETGNYETGRRHEKKR